MGEMKGGVGGSFRKITLGPVRNVMVAADVQLLKSNQSCIRMIIKDWTVANDNSHFGCKQGISVDPLL